MFHVTLSAKAERERQQRSAAKILFIRIINSPLYTGKQNFRPSVNGRTRFYFDFLTIVNVNVVAEATKTTVSMTAETHDP